MTQGETVMPKIMTRAYIDKTFVLPFSEEKQEFALVKPLSDTEINKITLSAAKEGGADIDLTSKYFTRLFLEASLTGWQGFYDVAGNEIPFSREMIREICECDPEFAAIMVLRIRQVAKYGELEERKN